MVWETLFLLDKDFPFRFFVAWIMGGLIGLLGALIFASGYPIFLVMQRLKGEKGLN